MSTNKTENLNLHSWVETDPVLMSEFNENFNALDAMAATLSDSISAEAVERGEAINSASTALTNQINSVNNSLSNSISSVNATLTGKIDSHAATAAATYGNCRIITGSYVGTGQCGNAYSNRLHFDVAPKWLIITPQYTSGYTNTTPHSSGYYFINLAVVAHGTATNASGYSFMPSTNSSGSNSSIRIFLENGDKTIVWRSEGSDAGYASHQANDASYTYYYIAFA